MWWTVHLEGGPRRVNHAAAAVGDRIFSFGGYCTGENYQETRPIDVYVLNTTSFRWKEIPKPTDYDDDDEDCENWPYQRYGHTVVSYKDKIYLFGGRNDHNPCNGVYCFDPATYKWSLPNVRGDIPSPRDGHSACVINGSMYIFSGYETILPHFNPEVYKLNLTTMVWTLLTCSGKPPIPRDFHTATAVGDFMVVFGGRCDRHAGFGAHLFPPQISNEYYSDQLTYLDTATLTWGSPTIHSEKPSGRRSHAAINLYGKLLLFGGYNGTKNEHKDDMWLLDLTSWEWQKIKPHGNGPNARRRMALCQVGNQLFLFGGTSPNKGPKIQYTEEQIAVMPPQEQQTHGELMDHNDLYVLDLSPSLRTLCLIEVIKHKDSFDISMLPLDIQRDLECRTKEDCISKPLPRSVNG